MLKTCFLFVITTKNIDMQNFRTEGLWEFFQRPQLVGDGGRACKGDGQPVQKIMARTSVLVNAVKLCQFPGDTICNGREENKNKPKSWGTSTVGLIVLKRNWVTERCFEWLETHSWLSPEWEHHPGRPCTGAPSNLSQEGYFWCVRTLLSTPAIVILQCFWNALQRAKHVYAHGFIGVLQIWEIFLPNSILSTENGSALLQKYRSNCTSFLDPYYNPIAMPQYPGWLAP